MGLYSMSSSLMLMKFSLPVAYGQDNWSVGIAPVIMYGALGIAFQTGTTVVDTHDIGRGSSNDLGLGYEAGAAYTLKDIGVTFAARYQSTIMMEYKNQISVAGAAFGYGVGGVFAAKSDKLEQPAEIGVGFDWTQGDISLTADFKQIKWADAAGYGDFGWENQNVCAIGAEYRMDKLALRAGFNYGKNPIKNNTDVAGLGGPFVNQNGDTMNALNHVMFPAVTEKHYTIGAGYQFTKNVGADLALMYATSPDVTVSAGSVGLGTLTVTNDQMAVAANLNYKF
jgi:long-chain fatty acid transport protein